MHFAALINQHCATLEMNTAAGSNIPIIAGPPPPRRTPFIGKNDHSGRSWNSRIEVFLELAEASVTQEELVIDFPCQR